MNLNRMLGIRTITIVALILSLILSTTACSIDVFPETKMSAEYKAYSFKEINKLEPSEKPMLYDMRIEDYNSPKADIIIFVILDNGMQKDLFSVKVNGLATGGTPKLYEDETYVYIYRDGAIYFEPQIYLEEDKAYINRIDSAPFIIQYEKSTGKISEKDLGDVRSIIILDLFTYENELYCLMEKRTKKPFLVILTSWASSVGFLEGHNSKAFNFKVVGNSMLSVHGCLTGDDYYFPALNGIHKINLKTNEVTLCVAKDYRKYNYVQIEKTNDDSFIVTEEKIISHSLGMSIETETCILEYSNDFQET